MTKTTFAQKKYPPAMVLVLFAAIALLAYEIPWPRFANAEPAHRWEYTTVVRERSIQGTVLGNNAIVGDFTTTWVGMKQVKTEDSGLQVANQLGAQGWELVTVYPVAGDAGAPLAAGAMTVTVVWVFKRQK